MLLYTVHFYTYDSLKRKENIQSEKKIFPKGSLNKPEQMKAL